MRFSILLSLLLTTACATALKPVPDVWRTVPEAPRIVDLCARVTCAERSKSDVRVEGGKLVAGDKALTPAFAAIQSFDVSLDRREVAFSAKRTDNFDVGLVSLDGSEISWLPGERVDETDVQWAPRGNKVSYIVHTNRGDIVRTLHVPTSAQLSVDFANARVGALAWDPPAERYAVVVESAEASQSVESTEYSGERRRTVVPAAAHLDVISEPIAGALVLRPVALQYNETVPLVVWIDDDPLRWSDARAALMRDAKVAVAIVKDTPGEAFWNEVRKIKWIDMTRAVIVGAPSRAPAAHGAGRAAARPYTSIIEDPTVPAGFYRDDGHVIRVRGIQSFAAGYIAHELKTNGIR
ncbi:MAG: hypothetical protein AABO58_15220 [Acidobacteriota bacterium]